MIPLSSYVPFCNPRFAVVAAFQVNESHDVVGIITRNELTHAHLVTSLQKLKRRVRQSSQTQLNIGL